MKSWPAWTAVWLQTCQDALELGLVDDFLALDSEEWFEGFYTAAKEAGGYAPPHPGKLRYYLWLFWKKGLIPSCPLPCLSR